MVNKTGRQLLRPRKVSGVCSSARGSDRSPSLLNDAMGATQPNRRCPALPGALESQAGSGLASAGSPIGLTGENEEAAAQGHLPRILD